MVDQISSNVSVVNNITENLRIEDISKTGENFKQILADRETTTTALEKESSEIIISDDSSDSVDEPILSAKDITFGNLITKVTGLNDDGLPDSVKEVTDRDMFSAFLQTKENEDWWGRDGLPLNKKEPELDLALIEQQAQDKEEFISDMSVATGALAIGGPAIYGAVIGGPIGAIAGAVYGAGALGAAAGLTFISSAIVDVQLGSSENYSSAFANNFNKAKNLGSQFWESSVNPQDSGIYSQILFDQSANNNENYYDWNIPKEDNPDSSSLLFGPPPLPSASLGDEQSGDDSWLSSVGDFWDNLWA